MDRADDICIACGGQFAERFLLWVDGPKRPPMCKDCARMNSGLRGHKTIPKLSTRRYRRLRDELEHDLASRDSDDDPLVPLTEPVSPPDDEHQERRRGRLLRLPSRSAELEEEPEPEPEDLADILFDSFLDQSGGAGPDADDTDEIDPVDPAPRESFHAPQGEAAELLALIRAESGPVPSPPAPDPEPPVPSISADEPPMPTPPSPSPAVAEPAVPTTPRPAVGPGEATPPRTPTAVPAANLAGPPVSEPAVPAVPEAAPPSVPQPGAERRRPGFVFSNPGPTAPTPHATPSVPEPATPAAEQAPSVPQPDATPGAEPAPLPRRRAPRAEIPEFRPAPAEAVEEPGVPTLPSRRRGDARPDFTLEPAEPASAGPPIDLALTPSTDVDRWIGDDTEPTSIASASVPANRAPHATEVDEEAFAARLLGELAVEPDDAAAAEIAEPEPEPEPDEPRPQDRPGFVDMTLGGEALALWEQIRNGTLLPPKEEEPDPWADVPEALRPKS